ncbi:MAG: nitrous oxide reductase accessory protein NosL [Ferruginibacter sp.]
MKNIPLTTFARSITIICGLSLAVVLFVPLWQIQLTAPQYPEGLVLKMYPNKLGGNVDIINGLNHYIGMKTLHANNFIEFTVLPYIIGFFAIFSLVAAVINKRKWLIAVFVSFLTFGIIAMIDFYRWNYNYGHDLDPNAAIQVPGMSYQPPLIGYKQLLNFGAYSIPDIGGWIFIGVGLLLLTAVIVQFRKTKNLSLVLKQAKAVAAVCTILIATFISCNTPPQPIKPGIDACAFCKMTISDNRFGAEIITKKGKVFKFDDMHCLLAFRKSNTVNNSDIKETYLLNFEEPHELIEAPKAFLLKSGQLHSPMGGNIANFIDSNTLKAVAKKMPGETVTWGALLNQPE